MKRRNALKSIVVVSAGAVIFPACQSAEVEPAIPVFENLTLDKNQYNLMEALSEYLLPKKDLFVTNPERTGDFILNMMNDCYSVDDGEKFVAGLKQFTHLIQSNFNTDFKEIAPEKKEEIITYIAEMNNSQNPLKFFFDKTLYYTKQHFVGSEYFLTKHLDWKFLPGEYKGCEPV